MEFSWNSVPGATGYVIIEDIQGTWTYVGGTASNNSVCTINGLTPGTTNLFDVGSCSGANITWGNPQYVSTPSAAPAAPSFTAAGVSTTQVTFSWNTVAGAQRYYIIENINGSWQILGYVGSNSTSCTVSGLSPGTSYLFDVGAYNSAGVTWGSPQYATTQNAAPAAPSFTASGVSTTQVAFSWNTVPGATRYYIIENINGSWQILGYVGSNSTSCTVSGLSPGTSYLFDVGAYNSAGVTWGSPQYATTQSTAPAAPSFTARGISTTQIGLSWNTVPGAAGYDVIEYINGTWTYLGSVGSNSTGCTINGLSPGTKYLLDVGSYNAAGDITWGNPQYATTSGNDVTVDHPTAAAGYSPVSGSLFGPKGPSYLDVHQGEEGDCWLMSALAEVAVRDPADIVNMFTDLGSYSENGSQVELYKVRFYNSSGVAEYVIVDTELPAGGAYYDQVENGPLWVALAEKAYAEANGQGIVTTSNRDTDSYDALNGGDPAWALEAITGKPAKDFYVNPNDIAAAWNAGDLIVLGSSPNADDNLIVGDTEGTHAYAVIGYNPSSSTPFELYNPWGISSQVDQTTTFNGKQVYDGPFWIGSNQISEDFASESFGSGASQNIAHSLGSSGNTGSEIGGSAMSSATVKTVKRTEETSGTLANLLLGNAKPSFQGRRVAFGVSTPVAKPRSLAPSLV